MYPGTTDALRLFIREAAAERNRLHAAVRAGETGASEAFTVSRRFLDRLTGGEALAALAEGAPDAWAYALAFFEEYPRCPDSGFAVRDLVRTLKNAVIPEYACIRLRRAIIGILHLPRRDEFRHLRQLAAKVADEAFIAEVDTLAITAQEDTCVQANAKSLGDYLARKQGIDD